MNWKLALLILVGVFVGYWVLKSAISAAFSILNAAVPILVIGAVAYGLYHVVGRKALSGGRRTLP